MGILITTLFTLFIVWLITTHKLVNRAEYHNLKRENKSLKKQINENTYFENVRR